MKQSFVKSILFLALLVPTSVFATNGYWSTGYGTKSKSIAGACVAMRFGAMCAASNPGSLVFVGNRLETGLALFAPSRGFTANNDMEMPPQNYAFIPPGSYESENDYFLIPHFAYNYELNEDSTLGIAIGGNGGMNSEYGTPGNEMFQLPAVFSAFNPSNNPDMANIPGIEEFDATSPTGIDMIQLFIGLTYSRKINEYHGIGITPILAIQTMSVNGLEPFKMFSLHPDNVTGKGRDIAYGGGLRVGWSGEVSPGLILGASYQTKMWMNKFDKYKGLFAEEGSFDIPANLDIGFSYKFQQQWTFAFNYQYIFYSDVKSISNSSDIPFTSDLMNPDIAQMFGIETTSPALGADNSIGFGWKNMGVMKFGLQWEYSPEWTLRAGYSRASDAIPDSQALFNILAPATVKDHYTFGFSHLLNNNQEISLAATYAANAKIYGKNPNTGPQTGFLEMDQWELELGWSKKF